MDFTMDLPPSNGFDTILTVVDQFTKMTHFFPCVKNISSQETADIIMREVFRHHDLPNGFVVRFGSVQVSKILNGSVWFRFQKF